MNRVDRLAQVPNQEEDHPVAALREARRAEVPNLREENQAVRQVVAHRAAGSRREVRRAEVPNHQAARRAEDPSHQEVHLQEDHLRQVDSRRRPTLARSRSASVRSPLGDRQR